MRLPNREESAAGATRDREIALDHVDDGGSAAAATAVGEGTVHQQGVVEGSVPRLQRNGNGPRQSFALRSSERLCDCVHVAREAGNWQHARSTAVAAAPRVAAGNVLRGRRLVLRSSVKEWRFGGVV